MYFDFSILHIILRFIQLSARKKKHYSYRYYGRMMLVSTKEQTLWNLLLLNPEAVGKIRRLIGIYSPMSVPKKNKHQNLQSFLTEVLLSRFFENGVGGRGQSLDIRCCMKTVFNRLNYGLCDNFHRYLRLSNPYISILGKFLLSPVDTFFFTHPRFPSFCAMDSVCSRLRKIIHCYAIDELEIQKTWCLTPVPPEYFVNLKPAFDFIKGAMKAAFPGDSFEEMTKKLSMKHIVFDLIECVMGYDPIPPPLFTDDNMYD
jgi:hypothetical protein